MKTHTVAIDTSGPCPQKAGEQREEVENKMTDSSDSEFPPQVSRRGAPEPDSLILHLVLHRWIQHAIHKHQVTHGACGTKVF